VTVPFWCLFVGVLLPYVWAFSRIPYLKELGGPDSKEPRAQSAQLTGKGGRIVAAQANAWEALMIFAPAVIVNHLAGASAGSATALCIVWVVARFLHGIFYMNDIDKARSATFLVGLICVIGLFVEAARA
jgi:uncharacterized MAPEG superfamily protein